MERQRLVSNCLLHAAIFMVISKRLGTLRTKQLSAGFLSLLTHDLEHSVAGIKQDPGSSYPAGFCKDL